MADTPPAATATNFLEFSFLFPYSPPVQGRSETPPVVTGAVAAGGVSALGLYLEVARHNVLKRFGSAIYNLTAPIFTLQK